MKPFCMDCILKIFRTFFVVLFFGISIFVVANFTSCASTGYPTGGPRDEDPPYLTSSVPTENSLNFKGDKIRLEFNELIEVSDIFQKLMVSPPVNEQPVVSARGSAILVEFNEELQPNTTYTIDFADAIKDLNEGNILEDFRFSFSTGEIIDSFQISGHLYDAEDLSPVGGALVMVHSNHSDTAFKKMVPVRLTKSNSQGYFSIQNLAQGEYRLYALEDANRNFKFDQRGERIAFHSELISPYIGKHQYIDSISTDSAVIVYKDAFLPDSLCLFLFEEENTNQYIVDYERKTRNKVDFHFNLPLLEKPGIKLVEKDLPDWYIYEHSFQHDSITLWLTDSVLIENDSLLLQLKYPILGSLGQDSIKTDTLNAYFFDTGRTRSDRGKDDEEEKQLPALSIQGLKSSLEILERLSFSFPSPIKKIDNEGINLYRMEDTIPYPVEFNLVQDPIKIRQFAIDFEREADSRYLLKIDSATISDIYGSTIDSVHQVFLIKPEDSYGIFYIEVEEPVETWLIQLLDRQGKVVRQTAVPSGGKVAFRFLRPADYFIRIVDDINANGKWDTGDFDKGIQPEKLYYFPDMINIRANWHRYISWDPLQFDIYDFVERHRGSPASQKSRR